MILHHPRNIFKIECKGCSHLPGWFQWGYHSKCQSSSNANWIYYNWTSWSSLSWGDFDVGFNPLDRSLLSHYNWRKKFIRRLCLFDLFDWYSWNQMSWLDTWFGAPVDTENHYFVFCACGADMFTNSDPMVALVLQTETISSTFPRLRFKDPSRSMI